VIALNLIEQVAGAGCEGGLLLGGESCGDGGA
jgi:hypothetical protein